ncbi:hypothetical protein PGTUg99_008464 [Puccinia graminis f. sp. tritici]|uniref:Uncharacterized protein n=1 Tax=Puccinia graminis f. sp. tritici TaxID=56615 RepID=A0A5B0MAA2_PUCGR|nr:hypothetical protein PGTUg99_008464 [Puccinia graminis f. sp. tritici]
MPMANFLFTTRNNTPAHHRLLDLQTIPGAGWLLLPFGSTLLPQLNPAMSIRPTPIPITS